ncbi:putative importin-beta domain, armadillo-like helical [Helianthus anomalus]
MLLCLMPPLLPSMASDLKMRTAADHILWELQNNPDMWLQVVHILSNTQSLNTKFFALQVLEGVIKYRWNVLPVEQRDGMKNYISDVIVKVWIAVVLGFSYPPFLHYYKFLYTFEI